jgi:hypothetical protein
LGVEEAAAEDEELEMIFRFRFSLDAVAAPPGDDTTS